MDRSDPMSAGGTHEQQLLEGRSESRGKMRWLSPSSGFTSGHLSPKLNLECVVPSQMLALHFQVSAPAASFGHDVGPGFLDPGLRVGAHPHPLPLLFHRLCFLSFLVQQEDRKICYSGSIQDFLGPAGTWLG